MPISQFLICTLLLGGTASAQIVPETYANPVSRDRVLVEYVKSSSSANGGALQGLEIMPLREGDTIEDVLDRLNKDPSVLYAEPDAEVQLLSVEEPNDLYWPHQWGMRPVHAPEAWSHTIGSKKSTVCIIDTGIDSTHPELIQNMHPLKGWSAITKEYDPGDDVGHGTHIAGIIGAKGNNSLGIAGVNWDAQLLGCKFLDSRGIGYISGILACLDFCLQHGAKVSANSYSIVGLNRKSHILKDAIEQAASKDHLYVSAAGNLGINNDNDSYASFPAAFNLSNQITVASIEQNDNNSIGLAKYSNYGSQTVHMGAPGSSILSTWPKGMLAFRSGTSMAVPFVVGAAALIHSNTNLSMLDVREFLLNNVQKHPALEKATATGGMLDINAALQMASSSVPENGTFNQEPNSLNYTSEGNVSLRDGPSILTCLKAFESTRSLDIQTEVEGWSCIAFWWLGARDYSSAIRKYANGLKIRDIKMKCKTPPLFSQSITNTEVLIRITVSTYEGSAMSLAEKIYSGIEDGSLLQEIRNRCKENFTPVAMNILKPGSDTDGNICDSDSSMDTSKGIH